MTIDLFGREQKEGYMKPVRFRSRSFRTRRQARIQFNSLYHQLADAMRFRGYKPTFKHA